MESGGREQVLSEIITEVERLRSQGDYEQAQVVLEEALRKLSGERPPALLLAQAELFALRGSVDRAKEVLEEIGQAELEERDRLRLSLVRATVDRQEGRLTDAQGEAERVLARARELADEGLACQALYLLGQVELMGGRLAEALNHLEEARAKAEVLGDRRSLAGISLKLAELMAQRGDFAKALELAEQAREIYRELGLAIQEERTLYSMGRIARRSGDLKRAEELLGRALELSRKLDLTYDSALVSQQLALVMLDQDRQDEAEGYLDAARQIYLRLGMEERAKVIEEALKELAVKRLKGRDPSKEFGRPGI